VADEPTGNLDSANGATVLDLLRELNRDLGITMLLATHAADVAATAHRVVRLRDGRIDAAA
jgi:putative ABC transport system ATP-binding protein